MGRRFALALALSHAAPALALVLATPLLATGCKSAPRIPGTDIPDTEENREILQTLERFRTAFVRQDSATILSTAHNSYYDEGGTDDPADDIVYEELGRKLQQRMNQIESIRFTMEYLKIFVNKKRATVDVWMDASFRMKPILDEEGNERINARFARQQDYARFELIQEGDTWLITKGI